MCLSRSPTRTHHRTRARRDARGEPTCAHVTACLGAGTRTCAAPHRSAAHRTGLLGSMRGGEAAHGVRASLSPRPRPLRHHRIDTRAGCRAADARRHSKGSGERSGGSSTAGPSRTALPSSNGPCGYVSARVAVDASPRAGRCCGLLSRQRSSSNNDRVADRHGQTISSSK